MFLFYRERGQTPTILDWFLQTKIKYLLVTGQYTSLIQLTHMEMIMIKNCWN